MLGTFLQDCETDRQNENGAVAEGESVTATRFVVPVSDSVSLRNTVAYAVDEALERARSGDRRAAIHFVYLESRRVTSETDERDAHRELLERVASWAEMDLGSNTDAVAIETAVIGSDEYLFSPDDYAGTLASYARAHDLDIVLFDPEYDPLGTIPLLPPLEAAIRRTGLDVAEAPIESERRSVPLTGQGSVGQYFGLFAVSLTFYLLLAGSVTPFELATGAVSAAIVAAALGNVSFRSPIDPIRTALQVGRLALYAPYLLWEVAKTNVQLAYIVLHPNCPLDPEMVEFEAAVWSELPVTTLANSITLTPGDLTVDVTENHFVVHVLTPEDRENLLAGTLERPVRYVFYGRAAARGPSPAERRDRQGEEGA